MSAEKEEWQIIGKKLDQIISLLRAIAKKDIDQVKKSILSTERKERIFELCDGTRDMGEIAKEVGVSFEYVRLTIRELEESGLITLEQGGGGKRYPVRWV